MTHSLNYVHDNLFKENFCNICLNMSHVNIDILSLNVRKMSFYKGDL